jgi:acyl transferase domain-containing protein/acyl carrier protein
VPNKREIQDWLINRVAELLNTDPGKIDIETAFSGYGLSSLDAVILSGEMEDFMGRRLYPTIIFDYPNIASLSDYLSQNTGEEKSSSPVKNLTENFNEPIAIVGMSCRFPGADNPEAFWQLLREGVDMIKEVPENRWPKKAFYHPDPATPGKSVSHWGGFLDHVDQFDPHFFGISPVEAKHMDPQQRLLLELSHEAFDDAGQSKEDIEGSDTGVYIGISVNEYSQLEWNDPLQITSHSGTGNALSIAANRISYSLNLRGPSMAIDTACSSSLAAIHLACQSLRRGECSMAAAGGVNIILSPAHSIAFTKAGVLSPDGRCKTFDAEANGYVRGEGGGMVILKRLSSAKRDGDTIHALILGSAMKQDGRTNGLIAPSSEGQEALLREAYKAAGVAPCSVQYVEAHGTGTLLGDSMEAKALGNVIGVDRKNGFCSIGSVKTNIGHLEAAAGMAGLLKIILSMKNRALPPSLHYHLPNPHIQFDKLNLKVNNELTPWSSDSGHLLAGINSFGFGGTNVHMIVRDADSITDEKVQQVPSTYMRDCYLLPLSSGSHEALTLTASGFLKLLAPESSIAANDVCYTAGVKRSQFNQRLAVIGNSKNELYRSLNSFIQGEDDPNIFINDEIHLQPKLAFIFSGQGGQWYGMASELLRTEPVFRNAIEKIDGLIQQKFSWSLMSEVYADAPESKLNEINCVQPVLFAIQVALAELWKSWGIIPDAIAGHSMGEVAAANIAGILSLEDAVNIISSRSKLLKLLSGKGGMIATELSEDQAREILTKYDADISVAAINSPASTILSGNTETLNKVMEDLQRRNLFCKKVNVDVASHSPQIDDLQSQMFELLKDTQSSPAIIPFYSTVTGARADAIDLDAQYWIDNLRKPVLFSDTVSALLDSGYSVFVEIGPHPVLLSSIQQSLKPHHQQVVLVPSLRRDEPEQSVMFKALGTLYTRGFGINWKNLYPGSKKNIPLPPVVWNRQRYWVDVNPAISKQPLGLSQSPYKKFHSLLGERISLANSPSSFIWQTVLDSETIPFLKDHRIDNEIVFPAAAYIEMALQAAQETDVNISHQLFDIAFKEILMLKKGESVTIQTQMVGDKENNFLFNVYSRYNLKENWTLHATCSFIKKENDDHAPLTIATNNGMLSQSSADFSADEFYRKLQSRGLQYGKNFRTVQNIFSNRNESSAWVSLTATLEFDVNSYQIHPALLDGCLQVIAASQNGSHENEFYLPIGCKHVRFYSKPDSDLLVRVIHPVSSGEPDIHEADIALFSTKGEVVVELIGFRLQRSNRHIRKKLLQEDIWTYQLQWKPKENTTSSEILQKGKHWLIFADDKKLAAELVNQLELSGAVCHLLSFTDFFDNGVFPNEGEISANLEKLISRIPFLLSGIIYLSGAGANASANPGAESINDCNVVTSLVQVLLKRATSSPQLWLVTKGAQPVTNGEAVTAAQSTLWGLGKTISFEVPELKCMRIDLDSLQQDKENALMLFTQLSIDDNEDQVAFRNGIRYVQRLRPFTLKTSLNSSHLLLKADRSYMVTGGMGGLGLQTALWMVSRGAKHLTLIGRKEPSASSLNVIKHMRDKGIEIVIVLADVSDPVQLKKVFEQVNKQMPPLCGIIHAAGVLDDGSLLNLTAERMKKVMAPKVIGTWNLHNESLQLELDFFVLFSSAVSVLGSPGQGNYAAASSYLDAMAHLRHSMGLPAFSINWGPWADVGLAAQATEKLESQNASTPHLVKVIEIDRGLEILEQLLCESIPQLMVLPFDLKNLIELYPAAAGMLFLSEVGGHATPIARRYARPKLRQHYIAPRNELERKLAELWRQTLHIDNVGVQDSFFELGGDSVLAAQILGLAQKTFGIRINPQDAFKAFTIEKLAEMLEMEIMNKIELMTEVEAEEKLSKGN